MRLIFLSILIANLAVAGWWGYGHYYAPDATTVTPAAPAQESDTSRLRLLQELPAAERLALSPPVQPEAPPVVAAAETNSTPGGEEAEPAVTMRCYRVDGMVRKEERDTLAAKITAQNVIVLERGEAFLERKVYWVHIPAMKSYGAASSVAAALGKARIRDFFLVRAGDAKNSISLGLFTQKEGAEKRQQEIAKLHLDAPRPEIRERTSTVRNYWLTAKVAGEGEMNLLKIVESEKRAGSAIECPP